MAMDLVQGLSGGDNGKDTDKKQNTYILLNIVDFWNFSTTL